MKISNILWLVVIMFVVSSCKKENKISQPTPTSSNEVVYYKYVNDTTIQIVAQNIDGSNKRILVGSGFNIITSQVYSNKFVYATINADNNYSKISLYDLNTNSSTKIIEDNNGNYLSLCSLSPTLDKIAFNDDTHPSVVNIDGTNFRTYTNYNIYESQPVFTSDGKNIIFATENTNVCNPNGNFYSLNLITNIATLLDPDSYPTSVGDDNTRISINNNKILYNYNTYDCDINGGIINRKSTLAKIDNNGLNKQIIKTENEDGKYYQSVWSNNGLKVASVYDNDIFIMNADGSSLVNLTNASINGEYYEEPQWSPDDSKIVTVKYNNDETNLVIYNAITKQIINNIPVSNTPSGFFSRAFWIK